MITTCLKRCSQHQLLQCIYATPWLLYMIISAPYLPLQLTLLRKRFFSNNFLTFSSLYLLILSNNWRNCGLTVTISFEMGQGYPGTACNGENFGQFDFSAHFGQDFQCPHFHSNVRRLILINDRYRICTILVKCLIRTPDTKIHHMLAVFLPTCFLITTFPQRHQNISD